MLLLCHEMNAGNDAVAKASTSLKQQSSSTSCLGDKY